MNGRDLGFRIAMKLAIRTVAATALSAAQRIGRSGGFASKAAARLISIPSERARATNLCVIPEGTGECSRSPATTDSPCALRSIKSFAKLLQLGHIAR